MHEKKQFDLAQIIGLYVDLSSFKSIMAKVNGDLNFIIDKPQNVSCQFVTSEEKMFKIKWNKHASLIHEDTDLNEMPLIYMMNRNVNPGVSVSCGNLLRPKTVYVCEEVIDHRCLKIESEKRGMSGHGDKNHGRKGCYTEFNLYFEARNLCGTVFNSNNSAKYIKKGRISKIKPIVVQNVYGMTILFK
jgi:hypothetical protein